MATLMKTVSTTAVQTTATPPTAGPPTLERPFFSLGNERRIVRQRLKKTHPDHIACFGPEAFTYPASSGITLKGWSITGHLARTATKIQQTFSELVVEKVFHSQIPKQYYAIRCFLLGCKQSRAAPHVVALCSDEKFSQNLKNIIIGSDILPEHWYFFRLPYDVVALTMFQPPTTPRISPDIHAWSGELSEYQAFVLGDKVPRHLNYVTIEIWKDNQYVGTAAIGGMIEADGQAFAMTVAHVFYSSPVPEPEYFHIDESELEFFRSDTESDDDSPEDSEEDESEGVSADSHLRPVSNNKTSPEASSFSGSIPANSNKILIGHLSHISNLRAGGKTDSDSLDWALISLDHPTISRQNKWDMDIKNIPIPRPTDIVIETPSGSLVGLVQSDGIFGLPIGSSPQPVIVARVSAAKVGDSGSWVFHLGDRNILGMLIGFCPPLGEAYFLRSDDILKDIERQTKMKPTIASKDDSILSVSKVEHRPLTALELKAVRLVPSSVPQKAPSIDRRRFVSSSSRQSFSYSDEKYDSAVGSSTDISALKEALERATRSASYYKNRYNDIDLELSKNHKSKREAEALWKAQCDRTEQLEEELSIGREQFRELQDNYNALQNQYNDLKHPYALDFELMDGIGLPGASSDPTRPKHESSDQQMKDRMKGVIPIDEMSSKPSSRSSAERSRALGIYGYKEEATYSPSHNSSSSLQVD